MADSPPSNSENQGSETIPVSNTPTVSDPPKIQTKGETTAELLTFLKEIFSSDGSHSPPDASLQDDLERVLNKCGYIHSTIARSSENQEDSSDKSIEGRTFSRPSSKSLASDWTPDKHTPELSSDEDYDNISVASGGSSFSLADLPESEREESLREDQRQTQSQGTMPQDGQRDSASFALKQRVSKWWDPKAPCTLAACAERLRNSEQALQKIIEQKEKDFKELQDDHSEVKADRDGLHEELDMLQKEFDVLDKDNDELIEENENHTTKILHLARELCNLQQDHISLQEAQQKLQDDHRKVQEDRLALREDHQKLQDDHRKVQEDRLALREDHLKLWDEHKKQSTRLVDIQSSLKAAADMFENQHAKNNSLMDDNKKLTDDNKKLTDDNKKLMDDNKKLMDEILNKANAMSTLQNNDRESKEKISSLEVALQYLKTDFCRVTELSATREAKLRAADQAILRLQEAVSQLNVARDAAMHAHGMQIAAHDDTGSKLRKEMHKNHELQTELDRMREQGSQWVNKINELKKALLSMDLALVELADCKVDLREANNHPDSKKLPVHVSKIAKTQDLMQKELTYNETQRIKLWGSLQKKVGDLEKEVDDARIDAHMSKEEIARAVASLDQLKTTMSAAGLPSHLLYDFPTTESLDRRIESLTYPCTVLLRAYSHCVEISEKLICLQKNALSAFPDLREIVGDRGIRDPFSFIETLINYCSAILIKYKDAEKELGIPPKHYLSRLSEMKEQLQRKEQHNNDLRAQLAQIREICANIFQSIWFGAIDIEKCGTTLEALKTVDMFLPQMVEKLKFLQAHPGKASNKKQAESPGPESDSNTPSKTEVSSAPQENSSVPVSQAATAQILASQAAIKYNKWFPQTGTPFTIPLPRADRDRRVVQSSESVMQGLMQVLENSGAFPGVSPGKQKPAEGASKDEEEDHYHSAPSSPAPSNSEPIEQTCPTQGVDGGVEPVPKKVRQLKLEASSHEVLPTSTSMQRPQHREPSPAISERQTTVQTSSPCKPTQSAGVSLERRCISPGRTTAQSRHTASSPHHAESSGLPVTPQRQQGLEMPEGLQSPPVRPLNSTLVNNRRPGVSSSFTSSPKSQAPSWGGDSDKGYRECFSQ